jgi:hypothetical protein
MLLSFFKSMNGALGGRVDCCVSRLSEAAENVDGRGFGALSVKRDPQTVDLLVSADRAAVGAKDFWDEKGDPVTEASLNRWQADMADFAILMMGQECELVVDGM